ncbi:MAG: putative toxin-antitoxin system toxin component, PIN family [Bacteroidales bacterium]|nr:putative toxin-antitoxin system toxin component, PIN family [Bacteroidales bacterium]
MKAIFDCNILVSFLIGHQAELMRTILTDTRFDIYVCDELLEEVSDVCSRQKIRSRVTDEEVEELFRIIYAFCRVEAIHFALDKDTRCHRSHLSRRSKRAGQETRRAKSQDAPNGRRFRGKRYR